MWERARATTNTEVKIKKTTNNNRMPEVARRPTTPREQMLYLQKTIGNRAVSRLSSSGQFTIGLKTVSEAKPPQNRHPSQIDSTSAAGRTEKDLSSKNGVPVRSEERPVRTLSVVPKRSADAKKSSPRPTRKESGTVPAVTEAPTKESTEEATAAAPASPEKTPSGPEEDSQHQFVLKLLRTNGKNLKTPPKKPEKKQTETKEAANLTPEEIEKEHAYGNHLEKLEQAQPHTLSVDQFMGEFKSTTTRLGEKLPDSKAKQGSMHAVTDMEMGKAAAKQGVANQTGTLSGPLRNEAEKNGSEYRGDKKEESKTSELKADPAGTPPTIAHADTAAPKPKTENEISLDDKSCALDDALMNHNVNGQTVNVDEGSLAFEKSGEKTFDEAGETKRKAQDEIKKAKPRYREEEKGGIGKSQNEIQSLVKSGLKGQHESRAKNFDEILGAQKTHKGNIEDKKRAVLGEFEGIYVKTTDNVKEELKKLEGIEETLEGIIGDAQKYFDHLVKNDLEYIYTPGVFDYSDWKDKHEAEIKEEYEKQKRSSEGSGHSFGVDPVYFKALRVVQDRSAATLFSTARSIFISDVNRDVENKIAKKVVEALNAAKKHIQEGKDQVNKAFAALGPKEQKEIRDVLGAVIGKFETLEESVDDRQREIIADMARSYNQSVGKLKAKFDEIKKDVLTSWFEKAWNKIKAVVNAIIDFAKRIAELLGRLAHLVGDIISSPRYFFTNLVTGIGQGISTFIERIDEFLSTAFFDWLRGSSGVAIQMPKEWGPKGIFSLFTQLLNLGVETVWERMEIVYGKTIAGAFRRGEVALKKGMEIFGIIKNEGLGGLWEHIKESLGSLLEDTLNMIKENILYAAIKKVILEIGKMLVPGGGFIAIAEKVLRLLQFIVDARDKILDLIESFVDSVEMAVKGDVSGIVKKITGALTKFITIALDFLVSLFGLGGLKEKVERFIEKMRKPVIRGIDWVLNKLKPIVMKGKKFLEKGKEKVIGAGKAVVQVGVPEDPQKRLDKGVKAGVFVVNKLPGQRVTAAVIAPLLSIIKTRYRLQSLEAILVNDKWAIKGVVNPVKIGLTDKEIEEQKQQKAGFVETFRLAFDGNESKAKAFFRKLSKSYDHAAVVSLQAAAKGGQSPAEIVSLIQGKKPAFKISKKVFDKPSVSIELHYNGVAIVKNKLVTDFDTDKLSLEAPGTARVDKETKSLRMDLIVPPEVKAMGVKGVGKEMFNLAFEHFKNEIGSIYANWMVNEAYNPPEGLSDNLKLFILKYNKTRDNKVAAAKATWTAAMARADKRGYDILDTNDVKVDGGLGRGMRYDSVTREFVRAQKDEFGIESVTATFRKKTKGTMR